MLQVDASPQLQVGVRKSVNLLYWVGGSLVIVLAGISFMTQMTLPDLIEYAQRLFGFTFLTLFSVLVLLSAWSIIHLYHANKVALWSEVGLQAANGISTLALTFTLLGISLGIGSLSNQALTPDTVQSIIGQLTAQFSMAFMTTVLGLPTASLFRAWISILCVKLEQDSAEHLTHKQASN